MHKHSHRAPNAPMLLLVSCMHQLVLDVAIQSMNILNMINTNSPNFTPAVRVLVAVAVASQVITFLPAKVVRNMMCVQVIIIMARSFVSVVVAATFVAVLAVRRTPT